MTIPTGLLTTAQVAERIGVHRTRINALIKAGRLPAHKIGRDYFIEESDLKLVEERAVGRPQYTLLFYTVNHPNPEIPFKYPTDTLAGALSTAWVNYISGGRSEKIIRTRGQQTVFDERELRRAFALMTKFEKTDSRGSRIDWAGRVIKEMGKEEKEVSE